MRADIYAAHGKYLQESTCGKVSERQEMSQRFGMFLLSIGLLQGAGSPCDVNGDGQVNSADVQRAVNQAVGVDTCDSADLDLNGRCDAV